MASSTSSAELRRTRARLAAVERHHPGDPRVDDLRRDLRALGAEEYIAKVVAAAPPLTAEQRDRIASLLRPTSSGEAAA